MRPDPHQILWVYDVVPTFYETIKVAQRRRFYHYFISDQKKSSVIEMPIKEIEFDYDEEADVLYISFGRPREAIVEEAGNIGIRIDEKTNEIAGLTVIEFLKTFGRKHSPIKIQLGEILKSARP